MLQQVTGSQGNVLAAIQNAVRAFTDNNDVVQEKMQAAYPDAAERELVRQRIIANLQQAYVGASKPPTDSKWFVPRDSMAALAQSAMNESATRQGGSMRTAVATAEGVVAAQELAVAPVEQFGPLDPGWIECLVDGFKTLFGGKAPFVQHQALTDFLYPIADQITIALVADWGADNDAARLVAAQIKAAKPSIVIHLGDIYYAGQKNEALEALKIWPLADSVTGAIPPGTSFGLNGNHEMYSGGHAYFGKVFDAFGQKASYFGLRNKKWQILAFDSAYIEQRLLSPEDAAPIDSRLGSQWNWLVDKMKNSTQQTILLSHHQPISAFTQENNDAANLRADFQKFLTAAGRPIFGWFFGHEHLCTIYDDAQFPYSPRLIGHGCIPHTPPPVNQKPDPGCFAFSKMNFRTNANGDAVSGFALLKFNGAIIDIQYTDEDGVQFWEESWEAPEQ
jgi:hypothetical protein